VLSLPSIEYDWTAAHAHLPSGDKLGGPNRFIDHRSSIVIGRLCIVIVGVSLASADRVVEAV
jgi:hypothetical protein